MAQSKSEMICEIPVITSKTLCPLVWTMVERLSPVQWRMIAAGDLDSLTRSVLAETCMQIVQSVSTVILTAVMPVVHQHITGSHPQAKLSSDLFGVSEERIYASLGDSLAQSFSEVLQVQGLASVFSDNLTQLVTQEVALKVNFVLSVAIETPPSKEPAFFVSSTISCIRTLNDMVVCTAGLLSQCFAEMDNQDESAPQTEVDPHEELVKFKSDNFVTAATEAVSSILAKQTACSTQAETRAVATDIIHLIARSLPRLDFVDGTSQWPPNMIDFSVLSIVSSGVLVSKLKAFFASQLPKSEDPATNIHFRWRHLQRFSEDHLRRVVEGLKSKFLMPAEGCSVLMKSKSPKVKTQQMPNECDLPGAVPVSPELIASIESCTAIIRTTTIDLSEQESCQESENSIKSLIDNVQEMLKEVFPPRLPADDIYENVEDVTSCETMRRFTKKLTGDIYCHLMKGQTYQIPTVAEGRLLSDTVIYGVSKEEDVLRLAASPELSYAMTEDVVRVFLQQVLLWFKNDLDGENLPDLVFEVLTDIDEVLSKIVVSPREDDWAANSEGDEDSIQNTVMSPQVEKEQVVSRLLRKLLIHNAALISKPASEADSEAVINRLTEKCLAEIKASNIPIISSEALDTDEILYDVFSDLTGEFCAASLLQSAIEMQNQAFDHIFVKTLVARLSRVEPLEPKTAKRKSLCSSLFSKKKSSEKCKLHRFFSFVTEAFSKPFIDVYRSCANCDILPSFPSIHML